LGVYARYFTGLVVSRYLFTSFPWATFVINIVGAFLIGIIFIVGQERAILSPEMRLGIMVGFLGGYTTFSAYCLEAIKLAEEGKILYCGLYLAGSPVLGFGAAALGMFVTRRFLGIGNTGIF
jgi:fluoride exporter